jgi:hypothetical protein
MTLMWRISVLVACLAMGASFTAPAHAADDGSMKIGTTFYFDYFADLTDYPDDDPTPTRGFRFRRVYLDVKKSWGDVTFRHTTDLDYKFGTGNFNAYSKYAYLQHSGLIDGAKVLVGQHSPKTHGWIESRWHYRSVEKTMSDEQKWTSSAEFGIGVQGKAMDKKLEYYLDFNNGNGYKNAVEKDGMGLAARVAMNTEPGVWISGLVTANAGGGVFADATAPNFVEPVALDEFDLYLEGLVGWEGDPGEIYVQYGMFSDKQFEGGGLDANGEFGDRDSSGLSIFGRARIQDGTFALARFDRVDPNTDADDDGSNLFIAGLSHELHAGVHLQPTFEITSYEADGAESEKELKLTFYGSI